MTLRHITAAEVRHQQKERDREREIKRKQKRRKENLTDRESEIGIFSMLSFDFASSSFLALLVNKSYRKKLIKAKLKVFYFAVKKFKTIFCLLSSAM